MVTNSQRHYTLLTSDTDTHLEIFSGIWLDAYINAQKSQDTQGKLRARVSRIKNFRDAKEQRNYIEQTSEDDQLVLIVSGQLDRQLMSSIHQLRQVSRVYIDSVNKESDEKWTCEFTKLRGINVKLDQLISKMNDHHRVRWEMEEPLSMNMFTATGEAGRSTTGINGEFVFFQLLIHCFLRLDSNEMDKSELISCFEKEYQGKVTELRLLREFQKDYSRDKALWWYTRESFFYKTLNAALRKQNIETIFLYRSYIADMHRQLQRYQSKCSVRVYRSQLMSTAELDNLQKNTGQFVSVNSFLSTTTNREVADMYMAERAQQLTLERVLFVIDADPKVIKTKPFADITKYSNFDEESEILFMLGSVFRVVSVKLDDDQVWIIRMSLVGDDEHSLKPVLEGMKKENGTQKTNLCTLGKVLCTMGKFDLAKKYYNRCVNELSDNDPLLLIAYKGLADSVSQQGDYEESVRWYQKLEDVRKDMASLHAQRNLNRLLVFGCICFLAIVTGFGIYSWTIRKTMVIQGSRHGGSGGRCFDDADSIGLSPTEYCMGARLFCEQEYLVAIQFIYQQDQPVTSEIYGGYGDPNRHYFPSLLNETFLIHNGERINKVTWYVGTSKWLGKNNVSIQHVLGIQFHTTAERRNRLYGSNKGKAYTESYEGYTLGYAKGKSGFLIDMLQFVWYRQSEQPN